jgi:hypothetical protein
MIYLEKGNGSMSEIQVPEVELTDLDADRRLLDMSGVSLVVFTSTGCASCRWVRRRLPQMKVPVQRICWIDAGRNGGLVERYGVFHLPAFFLVRDGRYLGVIENAVDAGFPAALSLALQRQPEELP